MNPQLHPIFQPAPEQQVVIHHRISASQEDLHQRLERQRDAMVCACDWLRDNAPGRALDVLESNL